MNESTPTESITTPETSTTTTTTTTQPLPPSSPPERTNLVNLLTTNDTSSNSTTNRRYHHFHSNRTRLLIKKTERNYLSAFCSIFCIAVLIVSLIETRWFYLNGGGCNLNYLGVSYFFSIGKLETHREQSRITKDNLIDISNYILRNGYILHNCTNNEILLIMRLIIAFIFFAIFTSFIGLIVDSFGFMKSGIKLVRRHAIFHILTVILCLIINGFCFWITERIYEQQYTTRFKKGKKIDVQFDVSYYLIVFASLLSILSTAFTLIRRYPSDDNEHINRLLDEYTGGYFDDPMNMQRSLPATSITTTTTTSTTTPTVNVNNSAATGDSLITSQNNQTTATSRVFQSTLPPPPPPPPTSSSSLSINIITNPIESSIDINEPPPPYLFDNDNDTTPLIF